jgi:formylglycine-generating enzyme required for sulfatase activity
MRTTTWVAFCLLLTAAFSIHAGTRALVIGNGAYKETPFLRNPVQGAPAIAAASGIAEAYRACLAQYPKGQFSSVAKLLLAALSRPLAGGRISASSAASVSNRPLPPPLGVFRDCSDCPEMVHIPAGTFLMGSPDGEDGRFDSEGPVHTVTISYPLAVSRYPVTRGQWRQYLQKTGKTGSNNCSGFDQSSGKFERKPEYTWTNPGFPQEDSHPVVCITWEEARDYAVWLSGRTGQSYRLLSEAEYEFVNRAKHTGAYAWGSGAEDACSYANGADASAKARFSGWTTVSCDDGYVFTSPVGRFKPNAFGLYDTTGNVFSWTADCWHADYNGAPTDGSGWTTGGDCGQRVVRGGSWHGGPRILRAANRYGDAGPLDFVGFRLGRTL